MTSRAAVPVPLSDLGSYQHAVRLVLTHDVITATRPRPGVLEQVLRWADQMTADFRELLGYTLIATTRQVRLSRRLDSLDPTQSAVFSARSGRPFDRRRLAYLCLVLASFQRSRVEISLADLVRGFTPAANAIDGLGFDPTVTAHKAAVVDVLDWLADRGALRLSDGSLESWAADTERGDALYDIDHDICATLFRPARPLQHLTSAAGLLDSTFVSAKRTAQREAAAQRAARALLEHPVVYYAQVEPEIAEVLRQSGVAADLSRLTGLAAERRAEGIMLADAGGRFADRPFPGRGGAVNRAAGLLLAKIADLIEDPGQVLATLPVPAEADDQRDCWPASTRPCQRRASCKSWPGPLRPTTKMMPNGPWCGPPSCRSLCRSSSTAGSAPCSTSCTANSAPTRSPSPGSMTRRACWPPRCRCWPTCGCSARCPAARWSSRPPPGTGTSSWPCPSGTPTGRWPWSSHE